MRFIATQGLFVWLEAWGRQERQAYPFFNQLVCPVVPIYRSCVIVPISLGLILIKTDQSDHCDLIWWGDWLWYWGSNSYSAHSNSKHHVTEG